jgi:hypothetical protein
MTAGGRVLIFPVHEQPPRLGSLRHKLVTQKQLSTFVLLGTGLLALVVIAGGIWYFLGGSRTFSFASSPMATPEAAHLSIVVLPFTNLSNDPSRDYFADGITENLTKPHKKYSARHIGLVRRICY